MPLDWPAGIKFLPVSFDQFRLVVERVALAGGARHEELDDAPGPGTMVQTAVQLRTIDRTFHIFAQQPRQSHASQAAAKPPKKFTWYPASAAARAISKK